jgi:hypothetical protein
VQTFSIIVTKKDHSKKKKKPSLSISRARKVIFINEVGKDKTTLSLGDLGRKTKGRISCVCVAEIKIEKRINSKAITFTIMSCPWSYVSVFFLKSLEG